MIAFVCSQCGRRWKPRTRLRKASRAVPGAGRRPAAHPLRRPPRPSGRAASSSCRATQGQQRSSCRQPSTRPRRTRVLPPPSRPWCPATRSWASWAAAAWAWSTRPGRCGLNRLVALKMILAGGQCRRGRPGPLPARGRGGRPPAAPQHRPDLRGRRAGRPALSSPWNSSRAAAWPSGSTARRSRRARRPAWWRPWPGPSTPPTSSGIIHRDLKPANILLDGGRHPQDHRLRPGQAARRRTAARPSTGAIMGTPSYMAPEQADGKTRPGRPGHRRLCPGRDPLRAADRPAAVPGRHRRWTRSAGAARGAGAAQPAAAAGAAATWRPSA